MQKKYFIWIKNGKELEFTWEYVTKSQHNIYKGATIKFLLQTAKNLNKISTLTHTFITRRIELGIGKKKERTIHL